MAFLFVVVALSYATFAPKVLSKGKPLEPADRAFGPFTASAEMTNGRAAMLGFVALLAVEFVRGAALF